MNAQAPGQPDWWGAASKFEGDSSQPHIRRAREPIRVALLDDHHVVREGLRMVLSTADDIDVVGEGATRADAFDLVAATKPDVLLLDLTFPDGDALPVLQALVARYPALRVLVLTMHSGSETVRQALLAGAAGYMVKGARSRDLFDAIRAVRRGERYLHSSVTEAIVDDSIHWMRAGGPISARERDILRLLGEGRGTAEMAGCLGISVHTVRRHIANLADKLGVHGSAALAVYAVEHGLTDRG